MVSCSVGLTWYLLKINENAKNATGRKITTPKILIPFL
jgi:hypothetical protein